MMPFAPPGLPPELGPKFCALWAELHFDVPGFVPSTITEPRLRPMRCRSFLVIRMAAPARSSPLAPDGLSTFEVL